MNGRREFIGGSVALATAGLLRAEDRSAGASASDVGELVLSEPMLQCPAETTMGVVWAVGAMATGEVEVSENADFADSKTVRTDGYGLVGFDDRVLSVRLTGLKPSTRYFYRTRTTRIHYADGGYKKSRGETVTSKVHSFQTCGAAAPSRFAVINDTHMQWESFGMVTKKLKAIAAPVTVWNGDALNATNAVEDAVKAVLTPAIPETDYASETGILFNNGNHEYRGLFMRDSGKVFLPRLASERPPEFEKLVRNFAVRQGDIALIGLDTGEDRPDEHPWHAGLCNCNAYRDAQTRWLESALESSAIRTAPFVVVSFHIPLVPRSTEAANPMWWSAYCAKAWTPVFNRHKVQVALVGHMHEYRCTPAGATRTWAQIEGGGYERRFRKIWTPEGMKDIENPGLFPTVIEGAVRDGRLVITVHDAWQDRIVGRHEFAPRTVCSQVGLDRLAEQPAMACDDTFATRVSRRNFRRVAL